jgi:hypothetical protein
MINTNDIGVLVALSAINSPDGCYYFAERR